MRAVDIPFHEEDFRRRGIDAHGKPFILRPLAIPLGEGMPELSVVVCTPKNQDTSFYYRREYPKERIVLHFTAGYLKGDIAYLSRPNIHVSVAFVIARDGTIYNLWKSSFWSYHLGAKAVGGNQKMSRSSIGIELSNIGPLVRHGDELHSIYGAPYCALDENEFYAQAPFRGFEYYATFTPAQYESLAGLLRYCVRRYGIPKNFLPQEKRFLTLPDVADFRGIVSHINFRQDKYDIGPALDWQRVIAGLG